MHAKPVVTTTTATTTTTTATVHNPILETRFQDVSGSDILIDIPHPELIRVGNDIYRTVSSEEEEEWRSIFSRRQPCDETASRLSLGVSAPITSLTGSTSSTAATTSPSFGSCLSGGGTLEPENPSSVRQHTFPIPPMEPYNPPTLRMLTTAASLPSVPTPGEVELVSFNMHFDFDEALPSIGDATGNYTDSLIKPLHDF